MHAWVEDASGFLFAREMSICFPLAFTKTRVCFWEGVCVQPGLELTQSVSPDLAPVPRIVLGRWAEKAGWDGSKGTLWGWAMMWVVAEVVQVVSGERTCHLHGTLIGSSRPLWRQQADPTRAGAGP